MLRPHVDHDPLVAPLGLLGDDRVPVLAGDGVDMAFGGVLDPGRERVVYRGVRGGLPPRRRCRGH